MIRGGGGVCVKKQSRKFSRSSTVQMFRQKVKTRVFQKNKRKKGGLYVCRFVKKVQQDPLTVIWLTKVDTFSGKILYGILSSKKDE